MNASKWEIRQDVEGQPFTDEYRVDVNLSKFHTRQNTGGDNRVYLVPKYNFTTGDILEYDFRVVYKEGNYMQMNLLTGDQYIRVGIMGYNNGVQGYDELGTSHIKIEFQENNFHLERITPSNITLIDNLALTNANGEYELYIGSVFTNKARIDFDNFMLCTEQEEPSCQDRIIELENEIERLNEKVTLLEKLINYLKRSIHYYSSIRKNFLCYSLKESGERNITDFDLGLKCNIGENFTLKSCFCTTRLR